MMLLPMLNGGSVANEWHPISALMCSAPTSFCRIFIAAKNGRSGHPVHNPEGRAGTSAASLAAGTGEASVLGGGGGPPAGAQCRPPFVDKLADPLAQRIDGVFAKHRQRALAHDARIHIVLAQNLARSLLDILGLALLEDQYCALAAAESDPFFIYERVRDVEQVQRHLAAPERIGAIEQ